MKPPLSWLLQLYPRQWRERYGEEFEALLEDTNATWSQIPDILWEALKMRIIAINWRLLAACSFAGLVIGAAGSFVIHDRYISTATLRFDAGAQGDLVARREVDLSIRNLLSRTSLSNVIQTPGLDLYKQERARKPLEDVMEDMKAHDLKVMLGPAGSLMIRYQAESPEQAQAAVRLLTTRILDEHQNRQHSLANLARDFQHDTGRTLALPTGIGLEVLDPPSRDASPIYPNRPIVAVVGLIGGLLTSFVILLIRRAPRVWLISTVMILLADGATNFLPLPYESQATMLFDSPATLRALVKERAIVLAGLESQSWRGIDLIPDQSGTGLVIRVRNSDRFVAQRTAQETVSRFVDRLARNRDALNSAWVVAGPMAEVLDPPSLPVWPMGDAWRDAIAEGAFVLALISGGILLFRRRQVQLRSQPA